MQLTRKAKIALATFLLFDVLLIIVWTELYSVRALRKDVVELRELGTTIFPTPAVVEAFNLTDETDNAFGKEDLLGQWNLMFFGFTFCPDICPLTMIALEQFYSSIESELLPQIVLVSVDPNRDDVETMNSYVNSFHEDFIGLTGDADELAALADQFYVVHEMDMSNGISNSHDSHAAAPSQFELQGLDQAMTMSDDNYLINHSGHISIISPDGKFHSVMRPPHRNRDIKKVFEILISNFHF
jgi:protein SCO1/2